MSATIKLPTPLRRHADLNKSFATCAPDVAAALQALTGAYPALRASLFDEAGEVKSFVRLFVDGRDIEDLEGLATRLGDDAVLSIVPPVAGA